MRTLPLAILPLLLAAPTAQSPTGPTWHTDLAAARKVAAETHAPLFVTFRCER